MNWVRMDVRAIFTMLPAEESGWKTPIHSGLRPNHNFIGSGNRNMCMGSIEIKGGGQISPGESKEVVITFLLLPEYAALFKPGFKWHIQAGSQHFANGEVVEILGP